MSDDLSLFQRSRKLTTYGKKPAVAKKSIFDKGEPAQSIVTIPDAAKFHVSTASSVDSTRSAKPETQNDVFDVPGSDSESCSASSSPADTISHTPTTTSPSEIDTKIGQHLHSRHESEQKLVSRKRKRANAQPERKSRSSSEGDFDHEIAAQFAREMERGDLTETVSKNLKKLPSNIRPLGHAEYTETQRQVRRNRSVVPSLVQDDNIAAKKITSVKLPKSRPLQNSLDRSKKPVKPSKSHSTEEKCFEKEIPLSLKYTDTSENLVERTHTPEPSESSAHLISTPKSQTSFSLPENVRTTPRQRQLWTSLFPEGTEPSPMPNVDTLHLAPQTENKSPVKARLVDTLKAMSRKSDASLIGALQPPSSPVGSEADRPLGVEEYGTRTHSLETLDPRDETCIASNEESYQILRRNHGPRITYGSQREEAQMEVPETIEELLSQHAETAMATDTANPDDAFDIDSDSDNGGKSIKNIHELRAAGDSRRFENEIDDLVQQVSSVAKSAVSLKRSALIGLCRNLQDFQFRMRFLEHACEHRIFSHCTSDSDPVIGFAAATAVVLLLVEGKVETCATNLHHSGVLQTLANMIQYDQDINLIIKRRDMNMSKLAQASVLELREEILQFNLSTSETFSVSPQTMCLKAMNLLVSKLRGGGDMSRILKPDALAHLATKLSFTDSDEMIVVILSILESFTISTACASAQLHSSVIETLVSALTKHFNSTLDKDLEKQVLILRLCLNLVNDSELNAKLFAQSAFIGKLCKRIISGFEAVEDIEHKSSDTSRLDALVLAVAAAMTLAEMSDAARQAIAFSSGHTLSRLIGIFVDARLLAAEASSLEQSHANVAYGYLALMLANVCRNSEIQTIVKNALPGRDLRILLEAVDEFIQYHKRADKRDDGNDVWIAFTNRLQSAADALEASSS